MAEESLVEVTSEEPASEPTSTSGSRPDWLPEKYWDDEKAEANVKSIVDALAGTQTALRNKKEELRKEVEAELKADTPPEPDSYKSDPTEWELPDGKQFQFAENDPLVGGVKQWAHRNGISQKAFNELLGTYAKVSVATQPDRQTEMAALGEKAEDRLKRLGSLAGKALGDEAELAEFAQMTMTARQVAVLEKLIDIGKQSGPQNFEVDGETMMTTEEELHRLMASDAYWKRDEATLMKAQRLQERLSKFKRRA